MGESQSQIACPKCRQVMQEGYLIHDARLAHWHEGPPKHWLGILMSGWTRRVPIVAYRCPACGYLEFYAK
jgi:hypothetical protein